jgi:hypothetical protein
VSQYRFEPVAFLVIVDRISSGTLNLYSLFNVCRKRRDFEVSAGTAAAQRVLLTVERTPEFPLMLLISFRTTIQCRSVVAIDGV